MSISIFKHVRVAGVKTSIPQNYVDIDDEIEYFGNNPKKLARQKKMIGYGRRYLVDDQTTVTDLAVDAAKKLMAEMNLAPETVDALLFVNQSPDYPGPCDACLAHGQLGLRKEVPSLSLNLGCSGYVYALWTAHSLIESGAVKNCLLLAGDIPSRTSRKENRKSAPVFGDAASATFLTYSPELTESHFVLGSDGSGWNLLTKPFGGMRLPYAKETFDLSAADEGGNVWDPNQGVMQGEEVFGFTMDVAPKLINDLLSAAQWNSADVDLYAIHQANKQILEMIVSKAGIPLEKTPVDVFSKYANNSTNSVVTVLCDQPKDNVVDKAILCTFGVGLSWAGAALHLVGIYNGGISTYIPPEDRPTREQQIEMWIKQFKGV